MFSHSVFLVLAAGSSRRFGSQKLAAPLASNAKTGHSILEATLHNILLGAPGAKICVVCCEEQSKTLAVLEGFDIEIAIMPGLSQGIGDSIAFGIKHLKAYFSAYKGRTIKGCWVCLGDMPFIRPETYRILNHAIQCKTSGAHPLQAAPYHSSNKALTKRGHPVYFSQHYFSRLETLTGDNGAAKIINGHALLKIAVTDLGIYQDIDVPADIIHFKAGLNPE